MSIENTVIIEQVLECGNKRSLAIIDAVFLAEAMIHDPVVFAVTMVESFKQFVSSCSTVFPDLQQTLADCFAADNKVSARWTVRGPDGVEYLGTPVKFVNEPGRPSETVSRLGEHTDLILERLGYDENERQRLKRAGVF